MRGPRLRVQDGNVCTPVAPGNGDEACCGRANGTTRANPAPQHLAVAQIDSNEFVTRQAGERHPADWVGDAGGKWSSHTAPLLSEPSSVLKRKLQLAQGKLALCPTLSMGARCAAARRREQT